MDLALCKSLCIAWFLHLTLCSSKSLWVKIWTFERFQRFKENCSNIELTINSYILNLVIVFVFVWELWWEKLSFTEISILFSCFRSIAIEKSTKLIKCVEILERKLNNSQFAGAFDRNCGLSSVHPRDLYKLFIQHRHLLRFRSHLFLFTRITFDWLKQHTAQFHV